MNLKGKNIMFGLTVLAAMLWGCSNAPKASAPPTTEAKKPFMFSEAPLPRGYPKPGPVGVVIVKDYPAARAATVRSYDLNGADSNRMFMPLFNHIKKNDIAMTAPVVMGYEDDTAQSRPASMAFLYQDSSIGTLGADGQVMVSEMPAMTVVSIGVRGDYNQAQFENAIKQLESWLKSKGAEYEASGSPRYLGYNSPFVPRLLRYGEVQIPISRK